MGKKILITGGAGFIGSAVIRYIIERTEHHVLNVDKLTYAGHLESLLTVSDNSRYQFSQVDICDQANIENLFEVFEPDVVMHLAAESHVDRSILDASQFIKTNIVGTHVLLKVAYEYYSGLNNDKKGMFRFHHVSTDEVYGDLGGQKNKFIETSNYAPSSPYAASKASSDHLVRAWYRTYGLPIVVTNCSNNYGPYQFPEKLIPLTIMNAISGKSLPVYGNGLQVRDWLYVEDHAKALLTVALKAKIGQTYNIGANNEYKNIDVVRAICELLEEAAPEKARGVKKYSDLITYVDDRLGHDLHYAIDASKIKKDLNWEPEETFISGLRKTVQWYLSNREWVTTIQNKCIY